MITFDKYVVWKCPHCGRWQAKQNNKFTIGMSEAGKSQAINKLIMKCVYCNKTKKFIDAKKGGTATKHLWCKHPYDATNIVQKLNSPR